MLTEVEFKEALPVKFHTQINQQTIDTINNILHEPEMAEYYKNNFIDYSYILQEGRYSLSDYTNAIKYCSYKIAGLTNKDSYIKTFPQRYKDHLAKGTSEKTIDSYVCAYNKTKLVTSILEQAYVPMWLVNQHHVQSAINKLVYLMGNAESEKVQSDSATSLLNHLKPPENKKVELDIGLSNNNETLNELRNAIRDLSSVQKSNIEKGYSNVKDVAESQIIEHEEIK